WSRILPWRRWTRRKRPNGNCAGGAFTAADQRWPPIPPGRREAIPYLTALTGIYCARPRRERGNDNACAGKHTVPALLLSSLRDLASGATKRYQRHANAESVSPAPHARLWNPNARPAFSRAAAIRGRWRDAQFFSWHLDLRGALCRDRLDRNFLAGKRAR